MDRLKEGWTDKVNVYPAVRVIIISSNKIISGEVVCAPAGSVEAKWMDGGLW